MNLAKRYERGGWIARYRLGKQGAIAHNRVAVIDIGKAKVQLTRRILRTICPANASQSRAEAMP